MTKTNAKPAPHYSLDVEADGPCPGLYSMLSFGLVPLDDPSRAFYATLAPISERYEPGALDACKFTRAQTLEFTPADAVMVRFADWLKNEPGEGRRVLWSDNPAFDWQFFNYYCHLYLGKNDFGHSARRIGDYWAGRQHDPRETSGWKKLRTEKHTHNALDDARGNAGALNQILGLPRANAVDRLRVSQYLLVAGSPRTLDSNITLDAVAQISGPPLWAIRQDGNCMNKIGEWEYEPLPSSRDDAFMARCRWASADDALRAWTHAHGPAQQAPTLLSRKP